MSETINPLPPGYWRDAKGNLTPESKIKEIDKLRHTCVVNLCELAKKAAADLGTFKLSAMQEVSSFVTLSLEQYEVKAGGEKGNVTLVSFDGRYKVVRAMQDKLSFDERLVAAKALIDECVHEWGQGANDNLLAMVGHAFQTDQAGKINTGRVLGLRRLDIKDEKWQRAMQAIADSIQTDSTKPYIRFYERDERTQEYMPIVLDLAAV